MDAPQYAKSIGPGRISVCACKVRFPREKSISGGEPAVARRAAVAIGHGNPFFAKFTAKAV